MVNNAHKIYTSEKCDCVFSIEHTTTSTAAATTTTTTANVRVSKARIK